MQARKFIRKTIRILGFFTVIAGILLLIFHFWFIAHARKLLENTVAEQTNGKINLKIGKLRCDYFSKKLVLADVHFFTTDTNAASSDYALNVPELRIQLSSITGLVFGKKLLVDSIYLQSPVIKASIAGNNKKDALQLARKKDISISHEMGNIYNSIQKALDVLKVKRFAIDNGQFILSDKEKKEQPPIAINSLQFQIDNLQVDADDSTAKKKILFSDNVILHAGHQDIAFPDGRHRLVFDKLRINIREKVVEFDSCSVRAIRKDSLSSSFQAYFDKLILRNIDFDTLYRSEVVKADTMYCINPKLELDIRYSKDAKQKNVPQLDKIIQQLTGDWSLKYVAFKNADFNIGTTKDNSHSSYVFTNNNAVLYNISTSQDENKPISVDSFELVIRNYQNFIKDSVYNVAFDSVVLKNEDLRLFSFIFTKQLDGKIINTFSIPVFRLNGLQWDNLIFDKTLVAASATLDNPHIVYRVSKNKKPVTQAKNLPQLMAGFTDVINIGELYINHGDIDVHLKNDVQVQLNNATVTITPRALATVQRVEGLKDVLTNLQFDDGYIKTGNLAIKARAIQYSGPGSPFKAGTVTISSRNNKINASLTDVSVDRFLTNERSGDIDASGIRWKSGKLKLESDATSNKRPLVHIKNVIGENTSFEFSDGVRNIRTNLKRGGFAELIISADKPVVTGLFASGTDLLFTDAAQRLGIGNYTIADAQPSIIQHLDYTAVREGLDVTASIPNLSITPFIQSLLAGDVKANNIRIVNPAINVVSGKSAKKNEAVADGKSSFAIKDLTIINPVLHITSQTDSSFTRINWGQERVKENNLHISGLVSNTSDELRISGLAFVVSNASIANQRGMLFNTGEGEVTASLNGINLSGLQQKIPVWTAMLEKLELKKIQVDTSVTQGASLYIENAGLQNWDIASSLLQDPHDFIGKNYSASISGFTGFYNGAKNRFSLYNANYNGGAGSMAIDSFTYTPSASRDSFMAVQEFQKDYLSASIGPISATGIDLSAYLKDTLIRVKKITADNASLYDYKNKTLPLKPGQLKPLPVNIARRIPVKTKIDTLLVRDAAVDYTEVSEITKLAGTIPVTRLNTSLYNVKNFGITPTDSLTIDATGYLFDSVWTNLHFKESYADTAAGFIMSAHLKPRDLRVLNAALIPLASVKLLSGMVDSLQMTATGGERYASGEMTMFYRNLRVKLLKDGDENTRNIIKGFASFIANTFLIKRNNEKKTGTVFFIREKDKSFISYLIKITISGMLSSTGLKNNERQLKNYERRSNQNKKPIIRENR